MADDEVFDVVVLGVGSGGEVVARALAEEGLRVAAVERGLVGGECPYVACVPSKAMLLAARRHRESGSTDHDAAWADAVRRRDTASEHRDDAGSAESLAKAGVEVVRGTGRVVERDPSGVGGVVEVAGSDGAPGTGGARRLHWRTALVVGTGSAPTAPPVEGLDTVPTWTSDEALSSAERPGRLVVLGGGAVGCELAQVYASFGTTVTLVEPADGLLDREPAWVGAMLADTLRAVGVDVRTGTLAQRAERVSDGADGDGADGGVADGGVADGDAGLVVHLDDGTTVTADRALVAAGRAPRTAGLGLDVLGVEVEDGAPLDVDERCRVVAVGGVTTHRDVFAVGDVTGVAPYTHTASYQGRIVVAEILGRGRDADYAGVPRAVYTDPAVFAVGRTDGGGGGSDVRSHRFDVTDTARWFVEDAAGTLSAPGGSASLELFSDKGSGVLVGAVAVGPAADSWAGELALAVRAGITVDVLADHVRAFPTWSEAIQPAAEALADES